MLTVKVDVGTWRPGGGFMIPSAAWFGRRSCTTFGYDSDDGRGCPGRLSQLSVDWILDKYKASLFLSHIALSTSSYSLKLYSSRARVYL